jgi:hypothetical protein
MSSLPVMMARADEPGGAGSGVGMSITKLEFHVWRPPDESRHDEILQLKNQMTMADYHFRRNAQDDFGIDPLTITTQIRWIGEAECQITCISDASEEVLSLAWKSAVALIGLQTERVT